MSSFITRSDNGQPQIQLVNPTNSVVSVLSKPDSTNVNPTPFKPRQISHYRKRLKPTPGSGSIRSIGMPMDIPSGSHHLGIETCPSGNVFVIKERIPKDVSTRAAADARQRVRGSAPRSCKSANNKNKYYNDNKSYLKARCRTYAQNSTIGKENTDNTFKSVTCTNSECDKKVIYKPSNTGFGCQGAVSSSNRLLKLKVDTISRTEGVYNGNPNARYIINSGKNKCKRFRRNGSNLACPSN